MTKQIIALALGVLLFVLGLSVEAQPPVKIPRIACVFGRAGPMEFGEAFRRGLRELGYVEGQNITVDFRWGGRKRGTAP